MAKNSKNNYSTAAGHMEQNSSSHVACSVDAIWTLLLFKWSQLNINVPDYSASYGAVQQLRLDETHYADQHQLIMCLN